MRKWLSAFTLIELLVVIAIIGLLSTLAVVALNSARQKSRDSKRVADVKQIQTALELYFADQNGYPTTDADGETLGAGSLKALCANATGTTGFKAACVSGDTVYMGLVPAAPNPQDGACTTVNNPYLYLAPAATTYEVQLCLGAKVGDLSAGARTADPTGIK